MECVNCGQEIGDNEFSINIEGIGDYCSEYCFQYHRERQNTADLGKVTKTVPKALKPTKKT